MFADCRPRAGRGHRAVRACSTTPARTAAPASRILVQRTVFDRFMELLEPAVKGVRVEDPALDDRRDGPADLGAAARTPSPPTSRKTLPSRSAAQRRQGPGYWFPPTVLAPRAVRRPRCARGDLRAGRGGDAVRRRGRRDPARQRQRRTGCPARSGPETSAGRCGSPAASRPATCRSTRTRRCGTRRRSAGFKQSAGWAASSDPTRSTRSPRPRTSSSRRSPSHTEHAGAADGPVQGSRRRHHRGRQRHRPGDRASGSRRRAPTWWSPTPNREAAEPVAGEVDGAVRAWRT